MAPSTPPPPSKEEFAALTITSTSQREMSPMTTSHRVIPVRSMSLPYGPDQPSAMGGGAECSLVSIVALPIATAKDRSLAGAQRDDPSRAETATQGGSERIVHDREYGNRVERIANAEGTARTEKLGFGSDA